MRSRNQKQVCSRFLDTISYPFYLQIPGDKYSPAGDETVKAVLATTNMLTAAIETAKRKALQVVWSSKLKPDNWVNTRRWTPLPLL